MRITSVDVMGRTISMADAFPVSYESHDCTEHAFVRLETDEQFVGYGEGTSLPWFTGETTASMVDVIERWIVPRVEGKTLDDATAALSIFTEAFPNAPGATSAVELALLDLEGKRLDAPVSALLGPRFRETVPLVSVVPALAPENAAARVAADAEDGFRHFKVKADGDIEGDAERINSILDAVPADGTLRIDANTGWKNAPTARKAVADINSFDKIEYFEQPMVANRPEDMRELWDETGVRVFADESVHGPSDLEHLGERGLVAGCHLKLAKTGSLRGLRDIATVARRHGLDISTVSAFGTSLEAAANLHLSATIENLSVGCELCMNLLAEEVADPGIPFEPTVEVPTGPGLGVSLPDAVFE